MAIEPVHVFKTDERSKRRILSSVNPLVTISSREHGKVCIQKGRVMQPDGTVLDSIPEWVEAQLDMMTDRALAEVGLQRAKEPEKAPEKAEKPKVRTRKASASQSNEAVDETGAGAAAVPQPATATK